MKGKLDELSNKMIFCVDILISYPDDRELLYSSKSADK